MDCDNFEFRANLVWDGETGGAVNISEFPMLKLDTPAKFGGKGRYPCPDELFISAIGGCLLTTFLYFKKKLDVHLNELQISVNGTLEMAGPDGYRICGIDAKINVGTIEKEKAKVKKCIELTKKYCHITRALEKVIPIRISERIE